MHKLRDEQTKLTATYLNSLAVTVFAVGGLAPIVASLNEIGNRPYSFPLMISSFCIFASGAIHYTARMVLKGLSP